MQMSQESWKSQKVTKIKKECLKSWANQKNQLDKGSQLFRISGHFQ